jgi:spermidine/putrescine transport system permease protein
VSEAHSSSAPSLGGRAALLAAPATWALLFLLLPLLVMMAMSAGSRPDAGGVRYDASLEAYRWLGDHADDVSRTAWRSVRIAGLSTLLSVLLATPVAWWIARAKPSRRPLLLLLIVVPSWTSFLLRTYAWKFLFGTEGPINTFLGTLGVDPVRFLNTEAAIVVGLVYGYLPFAVLPIYVAVERLDRDLLAAARDLGAGPVRTFARVAFPLTLAGTLAGAMLVFVPSLAAFVTPKVLGGTETYMIGEMTQDRFLQGRDWPTGAVLGVALTVAAILSLVPVAASRKATRA